MLIEYIRVACMESFTSSINTILIGVDKLIQSIHNTPNTHFASEQRRIIRRREGTNRDNMESLLPT